MNKIKDNTFYIFLFLLFNACGLLSQYSASYNSNFNHFNKYLVFLCITTPLVFFLIYFFFDYIKKYSYFIYLFFFAILLCIFILGKIAMGARRWIEFAGMNFQPSELFKIFLILALARYFSTTKHYLLNKFSYFIIPILLTIIPSILIFLQPNLGTSIVVFCIGFSIIFAFFNNKKYLIYLAVLIIIFLPFSWFKLLKPYQKQRIQTFLSPSDNIQSHGYNIHQSKIAIGSGGIFGMGFLNGSQNKLSFLPEMHTDFIFSVFSEEFGFVGNIILIIGFLILIIRLTFLIKSLDSLKNKIIIFGIQILFSVHFFINTFMVSGLIPATGIPLPFISYGRSFQLLNIICMSFIFIILNNSDTKMLSKKNF